MNTDNQAKGGGAKTPSASDLDCAAYWLSACQGEDRETCERVAEWFRRKAAKKNTTKPTSSK